MSCDKRRFDSSLMRNILRRAFRVSQDDRMEASSVRKMPMCHHQPWPERDRDYKGDGNLKY
jgi:hypothetical protein